MSKVSPTFCKHVIVVDLGNLGWILKLGTIFSLLDGCNGLLHMKAKQNQYQNMKPTILKIWREKNQSS